MAEPAELDLEHSVSRDTDEHDTEIDVSDAALGRPARSGCTRKSIPVGFFVTAPQACRDCDAMRSQLRCEFPILWQLPCTTHARSLGTVCVPGHQRVRVFGIRPFDWRSSRRFD
jgi:hypothetical protein